MPVAGHFWVEGTKWHWIDQNGTERSREGTTPGGTGTAGHYWVESTAWHYIDANGDERQIVSGNKYYPALGTAVTGYVYTLYPTYEGVAWNVIHDRAEGDYATSGRVYARINSDTGENEWNIIGRGILQFDTTSLSGSINTARLGLHGSGHNQFPETTYLNIYSAAPASPTSLAVGDYDCLGTIEFSTGKSIASLPDNDWVFFELNASGIAQINAGGITAFGLRLDHDADDNPPIWGYNDDVLVSYEGHDAADPAEKPYLEVFPSGGSGGGSGTAGHYWVESTAWHFLDESGDEYYFEGA